MTQPELAVFVGVSAVTVAAWEQDRWAPSPENAATLLKLFEVAAKESAPPKRPRHDPRKQWCDIAVELIFDRAPDTVKDKVVESLERFAYKYGAVPSPKVGKNKPPQRTKRP